MQRKLESFKKNVYSAGTFVVTRFDPSVAHCPWSTRRGGVTTTDNTSWLENVSRFGAFTYVFRFILECRRVCATWVSTVGVETRGSGRRSV